MAISDLFSSGEHKRNLGHFANVVKLAIFDNKISINEQKIIDRLRKRLQINNFEYKKILKNPFSYPMCPPAGREARLNRLYTLISMLIADTVVKDKEKFLLKKLAIGLGFSQDNVDVLLSKGILLVQHDFDIETFSTELKHV